MALPTKEDLTTVRKYRNELILLGLCFCVGYLTTMYLRLQDGFTSHLKEDTNKMIEVINKNTQANTELKIAIENLKK